MKYLLITARRTVYSRVKPEEVGQNYESINHFQLQHASIWLVSFAAVFCCVTSQKIGTQCVHVSAIQRSRGKEGNACFANEGHLRFVFIAFGFHCGCWIASYVSDLFPFEVCHEFLKRCCLNMSQLSKYGSAWPYSFVIFTLTFSILILRTTC